MDLTRIKKSDEAETKEAEATPRHKKRVGVIVLIISVSVLITGSIFAAGYYYGQSIAAKNQKKTPDNFLTKLGNTLAFASPSTGEVQKVDRMSITITASDGNPKTYSLNDSTRITKQNVSLTIADVRKGQQVTVFTTGSKENPTVTRIIIR